MKLLSYIHAGADNFIIIVLFYSFADGSFDEGTTVEILKHHKSRETDFKTLLF